MGASIVPVPSPTVGDGGILSAVTKPLRMIQREAVAQEMEISPSHVYQLVTDLMSEVEIVREAMGITDYPLEAEPAEDRSPIHVYARTLELRRKINAAQRRLGVTSTPVGQMPVRPIAARDVFGSVQAAMAQVRRIKEHSSSRRRLTPHPLKAERRPPWSTSRWVTSRS